MHSRVPCDGYGAPEDLLSVQVSFSSGASAREFVVGRFQKESCPVDLKVKCVHKEKEGWRNVWASASAQPSAKALIPIGSCYEWGSTEPAQYILSGWYKPGAPDSKLPWQQSTVKQVSSQPAVYEFTDPNGGTARLEVNVR